jgi:tRNA dimethylallyltransferase
MHATDRPVLIVAGPTGSGKSALALDAAEAFDGVVINADSMQIYRELRVLTARPSAADEARAPHRLFGVLPAAERCSAGRWLGMAQAEIDVARSAGRLPIVVGGTGLYLKALLEGLAEVPPASAEIRAQAEALHAEIGGEAFRRELARLDPAGAPRLPATDRQRLVRAFEVARATGRPLHEWQRRSPSAAAMDDRFATIALMPARPHLYAALDARFDTMLAAGAIDEVRALMALGVDASLPAMKAVGVREMVAYLCGQSSLEQAAAAAKQATRRFAKRQFTWLRHQLHPDRVVNEQYSERIRPQIFSFIRRQLLTRYA